jgi:hypothetical protein
MRVDGDKAEALALTAERFKHQQPVPSGESTLRLMIEGVIANNIDDALLTPRGGEDLRLSGLKYIVSEVGQGCATDRRRPLRGKLRPRRGETRDQLVGRKQN